MPFKARVLFWSTVLTASFAGLCFFPDPGYIAKNVLVISVFAVFGFVSETLELEVLPRHQFSVSGAIYLSVVYIGDIPMAAAVSLPAVIASEVVVR